MSYPRTISIPAGPTIELLLEDAAGLHWQCGGQTGVAKAAATATADEVAIYAATFAYVRAQLANIHRDNEIAATARIAELQAELDRLNAARTR